MAKKNKKNKNVAPSNNVNIVLPESLSADEIKNILVDAMLEAENKKQKRKKIKQIRTSKNGERVSELKNIPRMRKFVFTGQNNSLIHLALSLDFLLSLKRKSREIGRLLVY